MKYAKKERRFISPTEKCENLYEKKKELFLSTITKYEESVRGSQGQYVAPEVHIRLG